MTVTFTDICKIISIFFLPPLAVALEKGWKSFDFVLNVILTLLGWFPGRPVTVANMTIIIIRTNSCLLCSLGKG